MEVIAFGVLCGLPLITSHGTCHSTDSLEIPSIIFVPGLAWKTPSITRTLIISTETSSAIRADLPSDGSPQIYKRKTSMEEGQLKEIVDQVVERNASISCNIAVGTPSSKFNICQTKLPYRIPKPGGSMNHSEANTNIRGL